MPVITLPLSHFSESAFWDSTEKLRSHLTYEPIWQDISWSKMILDSGYANDIFVVGITEHDKLTGYGIFEKRSIGMGRFGLFCIGWPVGITTEAAWDGFLGECENLCQKEKCLFIQIEPLEGEKTSRPAWRQEAFKKFIEPTTVLIDLTKTEDEILAAMKPKGRYNIKVAEKNGVQTQWKPCTKENIEAFYALLKETTKRDWFATNSLEYFMNLWEYIEKNQLGNLLFASREGELLAAGLFIYRGKTALYYYGASVSEAEKRKYMASYAVQWEAILEGKRRGCTIYDFLGIAPQNEPNHHLAGVTDFKLKLAPTIQEWPSALLYTPSRFIYSLFKILRSIKNLRK